MLRVVEWILSFLAIALIFADAWFGLIATA